MTLGLWLVLAIRLTVPLSILRWPLLGAVPSIAADTIDIVLFQAFGFPSFISYNEIDKLLDLYYLTLEAIVALGWPALPRYTALSLFAYRLVGVIVFESTHTRAVLLVFPNLFELYFIFYLLLKTFRPRVQLTPQISATALGVLLVPKMFQEYPLHYARWLDHGNAYDIISDLVGDVIAFIR